MTARFLFQDRDSGEVFEHIPNVDRQTSAEAMAEALALAIPGTLVEGIGKGQIRATTFSGPAHLVGIRHQSLQLVSIAGAPLTRRALTAFNATGAPTQSDLTFLEEIGPVRAEALSAAGIPDLETLAGIDPTLVRVADIGAEQLGKFVGMAQLALTFPGLSKDDIQVLVEGLAIPDDITLLDRIAELGQDAVRTAAGKTETPQDYDPAGLIDLLRLLKR